MNQRLLFVPLLALVGFASAQKAMAPANDKRQLAAMEKAYNSAKTAMAHHPKDAAARKAYIVATDRYATYSMTTEVLTPHQRYPLALRLYREVLKIDPTNHEASNNSEMIISVYKSMHRPIPK